MSETALAKDNITRPEPGSPPARISFIEQMDGSAGYYVRFKDVPEGSPSGGKPERKYIPILQHETQEEALQAAINDRNRRAKELGLPAEPHRGPHTEETREEMSRSHNRLGLWGLGLTLDNSAGTIYPQLTAMWTGEEGQEKVKRGLASRGIWGAAQLLAPYLQEHIHTEISEEVLARRGAEGAVRRLVSIARDPSREESVHRRIESLLDRWAEQKKRDQKIIEACR